MKPNQHTSHPSAFISSTFVDLKSERACVADVLVSRGLNVNALDIKPASSESSKNEILSGVRESDFVVLIIGDRYGSIIPRMTGSDRYSITWWEYQAAIRYGKPVLAYYKSDIAGLEIEHDDRTDPSYKLKREMFKRFKDHISLKHNPAYFDSCSDLSIKVDKSIVAVYRSAVLKLTARNEELLAENRGLTNKIERLERPTQNIENNTQSALQNKILTGIGSLLDSRGDTKQYINPLFGNFKDDGNK